MNSEFLIYFLREVFWVLLIFSYLILVYEIFENFRICFCKLLRVGFKYIIVIGIKN